MKIIVNRDKAEFAELQDNNTGSIEYYEIDLEFDSSWNNLTKEVIFELDGTSVSRLIINSKVKVPFLRREGSYSIGVKGYTLSYTLTTDIVVKDKKYYTKNGDVYTLVASPDVANIATYYEATKDYQISTNLISTYFQNGAGAIDTENQEIPNATEWEAYIQQIQSISSQTESYRDETEEFKNTAETLKDDTNTLKETTEQLKTETEEYKETTEGYKNTTETLKDEVQDLRDETEEFKDTTEGFKNDAQVIKEDCEDILENNEQIAVQTPYVRRKWQLVCMG